MKVLLLVPVPFGVVTLIVPVVPLPTVALIVVELVTLNVARRSAAESHCRGAGEVGAGDRHRRAGRTALWAEPGDSWRREIGEEPVLVAVPPGVVTLIVPLAPLPTVALMLVALFTVNDVAAMPPMVTVVAPMKSVPVMVTTVSCPPLVGVKEVIVGTG